jgi:hypothetical protein
MITALLPEFINMSAELCGFSAYVHRGTGYSEAYYATTVGMVGQKTMEKLLEVYAALPVGDSKLRDEALRWRILSDLELGAVARNIIKLWYTGIWFELPQYWHDAYGTLQDDRRFIPFTYAYPEGLLGPSVGAHPQGAKAQGYASWSEPPEPLEFQGDPML